MHRETGRQAEHACLCWNSVAINRDITRPDSVTVSLIPDLVHSINDGLACQRIVFSSNALIH